MTILVVIKYVALILTLLVVTKSYLAYRARQESITMFLFWSLTWIGIIAIAFYPEIISRVFGERRLGVGSFLGMALVFVYYVLYRVYVKADRLEKQLHDIVRGLALKEQRGSTKKSTKGSK